MAIVFFSFFLHRAITLKMMDIGTPITCEYIIALAKDHCVVGTFGNINNEIISTIGIPNDK